MLTTFHRKALGSTLGWWIGPFGRRLGRCKQIPRNPPQEESSPVESILESESEYPTTCAKTGSPVERMNIAFVPRVNMVVLSSSISAKVSKMSTKSTRDTSGSASQHSHPHNNTVSRNKKFCVDQVTAPPPPPGKDKGWRRTRAMSNGYSAHFYPLDTGIWS